MRGLLAALALTLCLLAVPERAAASCVAPEPAVDRLAAAEAAFAGTVLSRGESSIRFRVDRAVKGSLPPEIELANPMTSVSIGLQPGQRAGVLLYRQPDGSLASNDCLLMGTEDVVAAGVAAPCRPRGRRLGCATTLAGTSHSLRRPRSGRPCLRLSRIDGCVDGRRRGAVDVDRRTGRFVAGTLPATAGGAVLRSVRGDGSEVRTPAALIPVRGRRAPFAVYVVAAPPGTRPIEVEAHGPRGEVTGTAPVR